MSDPSRLEASAENVNSSQDKGHFQRSGSRIGRLSAVTRVSALFDSLKQSIKNDPDMFRSTASTASQPKLAASFITGDDDEDIPDGKCMDLRRKVMRFSNSTYMDFLVTLVVLSDVTFACMDTDLRAGGAPTPRWLKIGQVIFFLAYCCEFSMLFFAKRLQYFSEAAAWLDLFIIVSGIFEMSSEIAGAGVEIGTEIRYEGAVRMFRLLRGVRMVRLIQKFTKVKELKRLVMMIGACLRTLFWAFFLLLVLMTMWALCYVEIVNPIVRDLVKEGVLEEKHLVAYSSVRESILTMFVTIIGGDGFGDVSVPVMRAAPATCILFVLAQVTIVYCVLNMVIAVVVDAFADQREKDEAGLAEEMDQALKEDIKFFKRMFKTIDEDDSGDISIEELRAGAEQHTEFRSRLRVMDIDEEDLGHLFAMLDSDNSGNIDADEFIMTLSRWRHESRTAARFVKYNVIQLLAKSDELLQELTCIRKDLQRSTSSGDPANGKACAEEPAKLQKLQMGWSWERSFSHRQVTSELSRAPSPEFRSPAEHPSDQLNHINADIGDPVAELLQSMRLLGEQAEALHSKHLERALDPHESTISTAGGESVGSGNVCGDELNVIV